MRCCAMVILKPEAEQCSENARYIFSDKTGIYPYCWLHGPLMLREWNCFPVVVNIDKGETCPNKS